MDEVDTPTYVLVAFYLRIGKGIDVISLAVYCKLRTSLPLARALLATALAKEATRCAMRSWLLALLRLSGPRH